MLNRFEQAGGYQDDCVACPFCMTGSFGPVDPTWAGEVLSIRCQACGLMCRVQGGEGGVELETLLTSWEATFPND